MTDHQPAVYVTLPYLAKRFSYPYLVIRKEDYYIVRIIKVSNEEKGTIELNNEIQVNLSFKKLLKLFRFIYLNEFCSTS
ncbi:hypothetical protein SJAV_09900 [Sulfurisphaera javensis]|uniref:Uncharacterized protein n=1 Tax=Sulfurisphaera javensis TaxID=2049879 RepID=A0AAT9GQG7_9CREN